ncbi:hypothetical protein PSP6_80048 [Paraburkholderia tropica]|nr:hypothetical protein PSP6_80048 [Paraburkholderia tropica]
MDEHNAREKEHWQLFVNQTRMTPNVTGYSHR